MTQFYKVAALFCFCFLTGLAMIHLTSPESQVNRDPASIGKIYDFSNLSGNELRVAAKKRLMAGFEIRRGEGNQQVALGHFIFVDSHGDKKFACQEFNKINLVFEAEGVSVSGSSPRMEVEGACSYSGDVSRIDPLSIPVAKILGEKALDGDFNFNDGHAVSLRFTNLPEDWPKTWVLKQVQLKRDDSPDALTVESDEVARYVGHPTVIKF